MPTPIETILPNGESPDGLFKWAFSNHNSFGDSVYLSGYPEKDCSLKSAVDISDGRRFLSAENYLYLRIHFNNYYIKLSHYSFYFWNTGCFTKRWFIFDITHNKNITLSHESNNACGTGPHCIGNQYLQFALTNYNYPIADLIIVAEGPRSDSVNKMEFANFDIYGELYEGNLNNCESYGKFSTNHIHFLFLFVSIIIL